MFFNGVQWQVVTWGEKHCGGDSSAVQLQLDEVQQVQGSRQALCRPFLHLFHHFMSFFPIFPLFFPYFYLL